MSGSHLRDARFVRALEDAPDAELAPSPATRQAILEAAARAVAPPAAQPWWRRLWAASGQRALPWNAAFATVLLASVVTLLWREREVPGAAPEGGRDRQAPAAPTSPPATMPTPGSAAATASEAAPATAPAQVLAPAPAPASRRASVPTPAPALAGAAEGGAATGALADRSRRAVGETRARSEAVAPSPTPAVPLPAPAPPPAPASVMPHAPSGPSGPSAQPAPQAPPAAAEPAPAAPPAIASRDLAAAERAMAPPAPRAVSPAPTPAFALPPPPPPAAVAPAAPRADAALSKSAPAAEAGSAGPRVQAQAAPPAPAAMLRPAATAVPAWDRLRLTLADGRVVELPRGQSGRIAELVAALVLQARGGEPVPQPPQLRIVLMLGDTLAGTLEIAPPLAAWMPARAGQALVARPEPALLQALIDEALRLAQR